MSSRLTFSALGPILVLIAATLIYNQNAFAQNDRGAEAKYYFIGEIDEKLGVQMEMEVSGKDLRGTYYYESTGSPLNISGTWNRDDSSITINEKNDKSEATGVFKGKLSEIGSNFAKSIEGQWSNPEGSTKLLFKLTKVADYVISSTKQGNTISVSSSYPHFLSESPALKQINKLIETEVEKKNSTFFKDAEEFFTTEMSTYGGWEQEFIYSIEYYSESLVSLAGSIFTYSGGAHPNTVYISSNYQIKDGKSQKIELKDLFSDQADYIKIVSDYCMDDLRIQGASSVTGGVITELTAKQLRNFVISPKGLQFAFSAYEVGSYAEGPYFVTVPLNTIAAWLDKEGPLKHIIKNDERAE